MLSDGVSIREHTQTKCTLLQSDFQILQEVGVHECVKSDVGELLKTSAKSLTNEEGSDRVKTVNKRETQQGQCHKLFRRCDFIIKGLGDPPGERGEARELSKTPPI